MRLLKKTEPQSPPVPALTAEDIAQLAATIVDAAVERRVADEVGRVRAEIIKLIPEMQPQVSYPSEEDLARLISTEIASAVESRFAEEMERTKAQVMELVPDWVRRSASFPLTHEALGCRFAAEYGEQYRFGVFGDASAPGWYRRGGYAAPWTGVDVERHLRDAWISLRDRLLIESDQDCIPSEGTRRRYFIEKQCNTMLALDAILESASQHVKAPK